MSFNIKPHFLLNEPTSSSKKKHTKKCKTFSLYNPVWEVHGFCHKHRPHCTQESTCFKCAHWSPEQWATVASYLTISAEVTSSSKKKKGSAHASKAQVCSVDKLVPSNTKVQPSGKGATTLEINHDPSPKPIHNTQSVSSIPQSVRKRGTITAQQYVEEMT